MLELQSIRKTFNRGTPDESVLFDDFSFTVQRGEFVSIVGSNGSGKTTLLNLISGSVSRTAAKFCWAGRYLFAERIRARAAHRAGVSGPVARHRQFDDGRGEYGARRKQGKAL